MSELHKGHRKRLKDRYIKSSEGIIAEYEILELLLCYANPRKDMKPLAKKLLATYSNINSIINEDPIILKQIEGIGESAIILFKLIKEIINRTMQLDIVDKPIISSWQNLINYLRTSMGYAKVEMFRILYLNKKNILIEDELVHQGTIDQVAVYPREIIKKAIFIGASAIILVHNHPSGKADPSKEDIQLTKQIVESLKPLNIIVHDHVIISHKEHYSFKAHGLL